MKLLYCYCAVTVQANQIACSNMLLSSACSGITAFIAVILQRIVTVKKRRHEAIEVFLNVATRLLLCVAAWFRVTAIEC